MSHWFQKSLHVHVTLLLISLNSPHPIIDMEVPAPPPEEVVVLTVQRWGNAVLVVVTPTEIVEQSGGQLTQGGRQGGHPAHPWLFSS